MAGILAVLAAGPAMGEGFASRVVTGFADAETCMADARRAIRDHDEGLGRRPDMAEGTASVIGFDMAPGSTDVVVVCTELPEGAIATVVGHSDGPEDGSRSATVNGVSELLRRIGPEG